MFVDWLETQDAYQRQSYGLHLRKMPEDERLRYIDEMLKAAMLELGEAFNEFSWKSWASNKFRNQDALNGELIDVLFFVANALVANGCTSEQLTQSYRRKMNINTKRQTDGYDTSVGKCGRCKRALDDPAVTCTSITCSQEGLIRDRI